MNELETDRVFVELPAVRVYAVMHVIERGVVVFGGRQSARVPVTQHRNMKLAGIQERLDQGIIIQQISDEFNPGSQFSRIVDDSPVVYPKTAVLVRALNNGGKLIPGMRS